MIAKIHLNKKTNETYNILLALMERINKFLNEKVEKNYLFPNLFMYLISVKIPI